MSLPWYVTVILFLLSPVYAILVRDRLWPRIQDWWATRSKHQLRIRITKLESQLAAGELLTAHTDFESNVFKGVQGIVVLIGMAAHVIIGTLFGLSAVFREAIVATYGSNKLLQVELVVLAAIVVNWVFLFLLVTGLRRYSQPRSEEWRAITRSEIKALQARLM
jgi:hypothetical protein